MSGVFHAVKTWPGYNLGKEIFGAALGYESGGTLGSAAAGAMEASRIGNRTTPGVMPPSAPGQDTAANAAAQQAALLRRRRGVLGTIYAGGSAAQPTVSSKSSLGN